MGAGEAVGSTVLVGLAVGTIATTDCGVADEVGVYSAEFVRAGVGDGLIEDSVGVTIAPFWVLVGVGDDPIWEADNSGSASVHEIANNPVKIAIDIRQIRIVKN